MELYSSSLKFALRTKVRSSKCGCIHLIEVDVEIQRVNEKAKRIEKPEMVAEKVAR